MPDAGDDKPAEAAPETVPVPAAQGAEGASLPGGRRPLSARRKCAFVGILLLFFLAGQELLLRLIFPVPEIANFNRVLYSQMFHADSKILTAERDIFDYPFLANASYIHASEPDGQEFVHTLNLYGFRDRQWTVKKPAGSERFMMFGDSFMEGAMAADEFTIAEGFRHGAEEAGRNFDVMNLGVQAMGMPGYMNMMADAVPMFKPDHIVIVFFENDFYSPPPFHPGWVRGRGLVPEYNSPWTPRLFHLIRNLRRNQPNPRRWISKPFSFFAAVPDPANPFSDPRAEAHYSQFVEPDLVDAMKRGRFNPFIIDEYPIDEEELRKPINLADYLINYQDFARKQGCRLWMAYIPINHQVSDHYIPFQLRFSHVKQGKSLMGPEYQIHRQTLATQCEALDIPLLDFTPMLREFESKGRRMYWNYDNHMKGESYFYLGYQLFQWIAKHPNASSQ